MTAKECFKCRRVLPLGEFYRHPRMADGHLNKCKCCTKADVKANYCKTRAAQSAYWRQRRQQPDVRAKQSGYRKSYKRRHPERFKAWSAVYKAVRAGRLLRLPCEVCGSPRTQAHHHDYSKPLDVRWLCFKCHRETAHGQVVVSENHPL